MTPQHLSDEAVAAFADGVLSGHARERAARHVDGCAECAEAVRVQREAAWALRTACSPALPGDLVDRLRGLPQTTPISTLPTAIDDDGTPLLATFAPMAALVPAQRPEKTHRARPYIATAAAVMLAGAVVAGSVVAEHQGPTPSGNGHTAHQPSGRLVPPVGVHPINLYRATQP